MPLESIVAYNAIKALRAKVSTQLDEYDTATIQSGVKTNLTSATLYLEKLKISLAAMEEIIKTIDGCQTTPTFADNLYFNLTKHLCDLRYYSLMIYGFKPPCGESDFAELHLALAPALKSTLEGVPAEVFGHQILNVTFNNKSAGIFSYFTEKEQLQMTGLSRSIHAFFVDDRSVGVKKKVTKLLEYGLRGELSEVEKILRKTPELMFEKGQGKDYSKRNFINVTLVEAMVWAWDIEMLKMMLDCINKHPAWDYEHKQIKRVQFKAQCDGNGVTYNLNDEKLSNPHYQFAALIKKHEDYVNLPLNTSDDVRIEFWRNSIGSLQRYIPACWAMALLYNDGTLEKPPTFKGKLTRSLEFYNGVSKNAKDHWFAEDGNTKLGRDFAIIYGCVMGGLGSWSGSGMVGAHRPLHDGWLRYCSTAFSALCKVKTTGLAEFKQRLDTQIQKQRAIYDSCNMM